jgi:hypothetical protein
MRVFTNIGLPKAGREMWKLANRISGESAAKGAGALIAKWEVRGLSADLLAQIRFDVFGVGVPAGP